MDNILIRSQFSTSSLECERIFRTYKLYNLLENIPLNTRMNFWFQLDDCPAHYGRGPRHWLNIHFLGRWISRAWPPRSLDLTPLDFFVWGTLQSKKCMQYLLMTFNH